MNWMWHLKNKDVGDDVKVLAFTNGQVLFIEMEKKRKEPFQGGGWWGKIGC